MEENFLYRVLITLSLVLVLSLDPLYFPVVEPLPEKRSTLLCHHFTP